MEDYENKELSPESGNETSASENETTQTPSGAQQRVDGEYSFVRPQSERSAYSDAGYVPSESASAVPRSYHCAPAPSEKKPKKEKRERRGMPAGAVVALCVVCAMLGGAVGGFLPGRHRRAGNRPHHRGAGSIRRRDERNGDLLQSCAQVC